MPGSPPALVPRLSRVVVLAAVALVGIASVAAAQSANQAADYVPAKEPPNGRQVLALYFGANWCAPCKTQPMKDAIRRMKPLVQAQAKAAGASFTAVLVAWDKDLEGSLEFARPLGAWDEYAFGGEFWGMAAEKYMWGPAGADPSVPQVLVVERRIDVVPRQPIRFGPVRVLKAVGGNDIVPWVAGGAVVDLGPQQPPK